MTESDVKKDLYKSKNMAKFSHYIKGNLYYTVDLTFGRFQFPIPVIEDTFNEFQTMADGLIRLPTIKLSEDLGTTEFGAEVKGSELNRWISKAIQNNEFIEIHTGGLNITKLNSKLDNDLDCPFDFTSRCAMGRCDCKPKNLN